MGLVLSQKDTEDSVSTSLFETTVLKIVLAAQFCSRGDLVSASQATSKLMKRPESGLLSRFPYLLQHTELQFIRFITLFHHCFPLPSGL